MSTFGSLAEENENIQTQYEEWSAARAGAGEDAQDWDAFRDHVIALGAPDPGYAPPDDFVSEEWKAENPGWLERFGGRA